MASQSSVVDLMNRLRDGDDLAATELFSRFTSRLIGLAHHHLGHMLTKKVDPEDVVQSAYKSFFLRQKDAALEVQNWDSLWGLLTVITLRKIADQAERFSTQKRSVDREQGGDAWHDAIDREPSPEEAAVLAETVSGLFHLITDPDERTILELSLQGFTATEISEITGRAERTVRRLREKIRKTLEAQAASIDGIVS